MHDATGITGGAQPSRLIGTKVNIISTPTPRPYIASLDPASLSFERAVTRRSGVLQAALPFAGFVLFRNGMVITNQMILGVSKASK